MDYTISKDKKVISGKFPIFMPDSPERVDIHKEIVFLSYRNRKYTKLLALSTLFFSFIAPILISDSRAIFFLYSVSIALFIICATSVRSSAVILKLRPEGAMIPRVWPDTIPWTAIVEIQERIVIERNIRSHRVDIILGADAHQTLIRRATSRSALRTHLPGKAHVTVCIDGVVGWRSTDVGAVIRKYRHGAALEQAQTGHAAANIPVSDNVVTLRPRKPR